MLTIPSLNHVLKTNNSTKVIGGSVFRIVLSARNADKLTALVAQLRDKGHQVETRMVDASDPAAVFPCIPARIICP